MSKYEILELPLKFDLENKAILKQASLANRQLAELKGVARTIPEYKAVLRPEFGKSYRHELLNHLFYHPYTKINHTTEALGVTRMTASAYLDKIVKLGLLSKFKVGRVNYYINEKLVDLLVNHEKLADSK